MTTYDGISSDFEIFIQQFQSLSALNGWNNETKKIIIVNYLSGPALCYYNTICDASSTFEDIIKLLKEEFASDPDHAAQFYSNRQSHDEKTIDYIYRMTLLAKKAGITSDDKIIKQILHSLTTYNKRKYATHVFNSLSAFKKAALQENEICQSQPQQLALPVKIQTLGGSDTSNILCSRGDGTQNASPAHSQRQISDSPINFSTPLSSRTPHIPPPPLQPVGPSYSAGRGTVPTTATQRPPFHRFARGGPPMTTQQPQHGYALRSRQQPSQDVRQQHPNSRRR